LKFYQKNNNKEMNNSEDLSGKIIFKVKLDKETRKIVIHNDDINFNELLLMMQRIFADKINKNDEIVIKYTDEENDLITMMNDSDCSLALQTSKILKLTIFSNYLFY
jgi:protein TFG